MYNIIIIIIIIRIIRTMLTQTCTHTQPITNQTNQYRPTELVNNWNDVSCTLDTKHYNTSCCELAVLVFIVSYIQTTSLYVITQSVRLPLDLIP